MKNGHGNESERCITIKAVAGMIQEGLILHEVGHDGRA